MQDSSSTSSTNDSAKQQSINNNNNEQANQEPQVDESQLNARGRRNALTPESRDVEPIRQTEIQEKMSTLTMSATSSGSNNQ